MIQSQSTVHIPTAKTKHFTQTTPHHNSPQLAMVAETYRSGILFFDPQTLGALVQDRFEGDQDVLPVLLAKGDSTKTRLNRPVEVAQKSFGTE